MFGTGWNFNIYILLTVIDQPKRLEWDNHIHNRIWVYIHMNSIAAKKRTENSPPPNEARSHSAACVCVWECVRARVSRRTFCAVLRSAHRTETKRIQSWFRRGTFKSVFVVWKLRNVVLELSSLTLCACGLYCVCSCSFFLLNISGDDENLI